MAVVGEKRKFDVDHLEGHLKKLRQTGRFHLVPSNPTPKRKWAYTVTAPPRPRPQRPSLWKMAEEFFQQAIIATHPHSIATTIHPIHPVRSSSPSRSSSPNRSSHLIHSSSPIRSSSPSSSSRSSRPINTTPTRSIL
ncbi:hypothetical protein BGZ74_005070, partial [Mortierella antarctica]